MNRGEPADRVLVQFIQAMRLFKDEPKWTPLNRSKDLDTNTHRVNYAAQYLQA